MVDDDNTKEATIDHASKETVHTAQHHEACNAREDNSNQESNQKDVTVLPSENTVGLEIFNMLNDFFALIDHDPAHVSPHESFFDRIWVFLPIGLEVVPAMVAAPLDG